MFRERVRREPSPDAPAEYVDPLAELARGLPSDVFLVDLEEFSKDPHRCLITACAGNTGSLVYTAGRDPDADPASPPSSMVGVAVIIPVEHYRSLTRKPEEQTGA